MKTTVLIFLTLVTFSMPSFAKEYCIRAHITKVLHPTALFVFDGIGEEHEKYKNYPGSLLGILPPARQSISFFHPTTLSRYGIDIIDPDVLDQMEDEFGRQLSARILKKNAIYKAYIVYDLYRSFTPVRRLYYGRLIVNEADVGEDLIRSGYACPLSHPKFPKKILEVYTQAAIEAKKSKAGFWKKYPEIMEYLCYGTLRRK